MRFSGPRRYRVLAVAIVLSIAIHFAVGPLLSRFHLAQPAQTENDFVVTSTSLRIARRTVPEPHPRPQPHVRPHPEVVQRRTVAKTIVAPKLLSTPQPRGVRPRAVPSIDTITLGRKGQCNPRIQPSGGGTTALGPPDGPPTRTPVT